MVILALYLFLINNAGPGGFDVWILHSLCMCLCICVCACVHVQAVLVLVTLHVQGQMVRAGEAAAAGDALEGFGPGVFPVVSGELVRSGETPVAVLPCATVRLLTCKTQQRREVSNVQDFFSSSKDHLFWFLFLIASTFLVFKIISRTRISGSVKVRKSS